MKRNFSLKVLAVAILLAMSFTLSAKKDVKYVFYMIGDGMGYNQVYATNVYNKAMGLPEINFLSFPVRSTITTVAANSLVTDSAAAGTALATGSKTLVSRLGNDPDGNALVSVAELAKQQGYGAAVITTVGINHATPGAFYGHVDNRNMHEKIIQQFFDSELDFAAGATILTNGTAPEMWIDKAREAGITVYQGPDGYKRTSDRVIYLSNHLEDGDLAYAIDSKEDDTKLEHFTAAAIDYLYAKYAKKGFFLMVEGGMIDHACHSNDVATAIHETNDFAKSIEMVLDFYRQHPDETLIVITADHESGGLSLGNGKYELHPEIMANQTCSVGAITGRLNKLVDDNGKNASWDQAKDILKDCLGLWGAVKVSESEEAALHAIFNDMVNGKSENVKDLYSSNSKLATESMKLLTKKAMYGWISRSHSGSPLGVWAIGASSCAFANVYDNTDVPKTIARVAGYQK